MGSGEEKVGLMGQKGQVDDRSQEFLEEKGTNLGQMKLKAQIKN